MKKFFLLIVILFCFPFFVQALEIESENAILYNLNDNTILFSKEADEKIPIAINIITIIVE